LVCAPRHPQEIALGVRQSGATPIPGFQFAGDLRSDQPGNPPLDLRVYAADAAEDAVREVVFGRNIQALEQMIAETQTTADNVQPARSGMQTSAALFALSGGVILAVTMTATGPVGVLAYGTMTVVGALISASGGSTVFVSRKSTKADYVNTVVVMKTTLHLQTGRISVDMAEDQLMVYKQLPNIKKSGQLKAAIGSLETTIADCKRLNLQ
jgi:hypothetical protein